MELAGWVFANWPGMSQGSTTLLQRARVSLHGYEYAVFPVQAVFAALAVLVVALDSRMR